MTDLVIPTDNARVSPLLPEQMNADVQAEHDKSVRTWGMPNILFRTMACHPQLALTEVDYANSFIFDRGKFTTIPRPGHPGEEILFPVAGFIDPVTKEITLSLVSLLNRSRYSVTHHTVIGTLTLNALVPGDTPEQRQDRAAAMLLNLVDGEGNATYENQTFEGGPLYSELQLAYLRLAEKMNADAHKVTDEMISSLRQLQRAEAIRQIQSGPLAGEFDDSGPDDAYLDLYVDAMLVELTWAICHFSGLLNRWFTALRLRDEDFVVDDAGHTFIDNYNAVVAEPVKARNNQLLGAGGWGD